MVRATHTSHREAHTPAVSHPDPSSNVTDLIEARVTQAPGHPMFSRKINGEWTPVTTASFVKQVRALAAELVDGGVQPGDRIALIAATSYEWALVEFASYYSGAILVPIYESSAAAQLQAVLADSGATLVFIETAVHRERLSEASTQLVAAGHPVPRVRELGSVVPERLEQAQVAAAAAAEVERRRSLATLEDIATLVYSSGTTGNPKGSCITHGNFVGLVTNIAPPYAEVIRSDSRTLLFLPLAHVLARSVQMVGMYTGMTIGHLATPNDLIPELPKYRPTFLMVVPRLLEKVEVAVARKAGSGLLKPIFRAARSCAIEVAQFREEHPGKELPWALKMRHTVSDKIIFSKVRALFGDSLDAILSGASALAADTARFFSGAGLPVIEGYGLTETTAPITGNPVGRARFGSVGIPMPGASVRIADDGEILVKGPGVIHSYWQESLNAEAFVDGFFRTGDLGSLDADGYLRVTGRAKDIIITSYGKNIAPEPVEQSISLQSPLVAQALVVGEARPFLGALITVDREALQLWAAEKQMSVAGRELSEIPELVTELTEAVGRANQLVSNPEQVKQFRIIEDLFTVENGGLTPTQKLKRSWVLAQQAENVDALYESMSA